MTQTNSWFELIDTTTPKTRFFTYSINAVLIDNIIWFIGVEDAVENNTGNIYQFDITTETWLDTSNLQIPPTPLIHGCLSTNGSHIFMVGGRTQYSGSYNIPIMQIYNIDTNSWRRLYNIWSNRYATAGGWRYQFCSVADNRLFIFGGKTDSGTYQAWIDRYDMITGSYTNNIATLKSQVADGKAVYHNDLIYLVGAWPISVSSQHIYAFDVISQSLLSDVQYTISTQIASTAALIINDKLWIFGGTTSFSNYAAVSNVEICDLPTQSQLPTS